MLHDNISSGRKSGKSYNKLFGMIICQETGTLPTPTKFLWQILQVAGISTSCETICDRIICQLAQSLQIQEKNYCGKIMCQVAGTLINTA